MTAALAQEVSVATPSFDEWVAARGGALLQLATLLTGNPHDAQDVVQEALAKAYPRWERIARLEDPDAYVRRMVVNGHVSWWRRFRRRETPSDEVRLTHPQESPLDERDRLWQACRQLPAHERTAVVLRYWEDLDYVQIADLTGVREGTVRSRVSRGLATLRTLVKEES